MRVAEINKESQAVTAECTLNLIGFVSRLCLFTLKAAAKLKCQLELDLLMKNVKKK